ncbi:MAG: hypothetical protein MR408_02970, partial [Spirochaetia bacterium]|nr:hypothetical protein [Spirochaetia bacterium]
TGLEVNVNKTTSYSDNTTKTSDVSVKYVDEKDSFEFIFDSSKTGTVNVSVSYKDIKIDNTTISVTVSEKGGNETPSTTTTINGIKVENNVISLKSLDNISALQTLLEEDKEIAKTVKTLNIEFPENEDKTNHSVNLVDISKLATNFPNAKINASDNIEYAINGGTDRGVIGQDADLLLNNDFKDLTEFDITEKITITKGLNEGTFENGKNIQVRTIDVKGKTKLNITGKYLDIGRNRFINNAGNDGITLPSDIEITTYNSEVRDANNTSITSDIAIDQYKQLGLTTPKFDLTISDYNAYNFAKNILENYSYDQLNSVDSNNVKEHKLSINNYVDGEKALYTGDTLNANVPSLKYDTIDFIKPSEVKNLKITGTPSVKDTTSSRGYTNVVFTGDMSSITFDGLLHGVIEFKDNPMSYISSENDLVKVNKIDKPIGTIWAKILDFRGLPDDTNFDEIDDPVFLGGSGETTGYFKNTAQKEILKEKLPQHSDGYYLNHFDPAYSEDVDTEKAQMKSLQSVAEEADESIKQQTALY